MGKEIFKVGGYAIDNQGIEGECRQIYNVAEIHTSETGKRFVILQRKLSKKKIQRLVREIEQDAFKEFCYFHYKNGVNIIVPYCEKVR